MHMGVFGANLLKQSTINLDDNSHFCHTSLARECPLLDHGKITMKVPVYPVSVDLDCYAELLRKKVLYTLLTTHSKSIAPSTLSWELLRHLSEITK